MWHGASVRSIKTARSDDDDDGSAARYTPLVLENLGSGEPPPPFTLCQSKEGGAFLSPHLFGTFRFARYK